jgi:hypothetical protein
LQPGCGNGGGDGTGGEGGSGGQGGSGAAGDGSAELVVKPLMYTPPDTPTVLLEAGDALELWTAPQGGHVVNVGARIQGLDTDTIELRVRVRDLELRTIVAEEGRTVITREVPGEPGWRETDRRTRSQVTHVALCPNYGSRDIVGLEYEVEVSVTELYSDFTTGSASLVLLPSCLQTDSVLHDACICECTANYVLGKCG